MPRGTPLHPYGTHEGRPYTPYGVAKDTQATPG